MPAGDLITAEWQVEIRGLLTGSGTVYRLGRQRISGLGRPPVKTSDVELDGQWGSYAARDDQFGPRILIVDYVINEPTLADAMTSFDTLKTAWTAGGDVELHFQLPGWGHRYVIGRTRGLEEDFADPRVLSGVLPVIAEFHALDPVIYQSA